MALRRLLRDARAQQTVSRPARQRLQNVIRILQVIENAQKQGESERLIRQRELRVEIYGLKTNRRPQSNLQSLKPAELVVIRAAIVDRQHPAPQRFQKESIRAVRAADVQDRIPARQLQQVPPRASEQLVEHREDGERAIGIPVDLLRRQLRLNLIQPLLESPGLSLEFPKFVHYDRCNSSEWTAARSGAEVCAPIRVTEIAAAAFAKRSASSSFAFSASATASAALNVSPAAVESTACTANGADSMV